MALADGPEDWWDPEGQLTTAACSTKWSVIWVMPTSDHTPSDVLKALTRSPSLPHSIGRPLTGSKGRDSQIASVRLRGMTHWEPSRVYPDGPWCSIATHFNLARGSSMNPTAMKRLPAGSPAG